MNKKDIALTVGGVVATMILAYLLYRLQQRDSAAAAAAAANQQTEAEQNSEDLYSILSSPSPIAASSPISTPEISSNANLDTNGEPENDSAASDSVVSELLGDLTATLTSGTGSNLIIPTLNSAANNALTSTSIPTTASAALSGGAPALPTTPPNTLPRGSQGAPN